jgi:hypothetical protein
MADKRISQLVERIDIANNDVLPIVASGATTTNKVTISSIQTFMQGNLDLGVTSVGLSMPSAFSVSNSPVTTSGNISVTGAGTTAQYIRGDGSLADFPASSGGGSSVSYYLNGSVSQGNIGGVDYQELSKVPILGAGTDFTINANGYIASFITDIFEPNLLEIPGGNWNFETYFQASSGGGSPTFYVELYKVSYPSGTATLIASSSGTPELIAFGTNITPYFSTLAVPTTALALTDRLAIRYYVTHAGRTITMHTENNTLCQIITTFSTGLTALNGLTAQVQNFATGTNGTDFNIESASTTHVFNLPTASGTNRGALSSDDWTTFNSKVGGTGASGQVAFWNGTSSQTGDNGLFWDNVNKRLGVGTNVPSEQLEIRTGANTSFALTRNAISNTARMFFKTSGTFNWSFGTRSTRNDFSIFNETSTEALTINATSNNILINTIADAGFRLDVNGTARVQGALTTTADAVVNGVSVGLGPGSLSGNTRVGINALSANTTGNDNSFFGRGAGQNNTTGSRNSAFGREALFTLTTNNQNSAFGYFAGRVTTGGNNSFFGNESALNNTTGSSNSFFGLQSGVNNTTGSSNSFFGFQSGRFIADGTTALTIANNSVFLGSETRANADNQTNQIVIGHTAIGLGSNTTVIGNSSTTFGRWFGNLLVGTSTNAGYALDVVGTARTGTLRLLNLTDTLEFTNTLVRIRRVANRMAFDGFDGFEFVDSNASASRMRIFGTTGNVLIGSAADVASSILTVESTTKGFLPPRMTTTQKNAIASPATGLVVYDTTLNKLAVYTGAAWETITSV